MTSIKGAIRHGADVVYSGWRNGPDGARKVAERRYSIKGHAKLELGRLDAKVLRDMGDTVDYVTGPHVYPRKAG